MDPLNEGKIFHHGWTQKEINGLDDTEGQPSRNFRTKRNMGVNGHKMGKSRLSGGGQFFRGPNADEAKVSHKKQKKKKKYCWGKTIPISTGGRGFNSILYL